MSKHAGSLAGGILSGVVYLGVVYLGVVYLTGSLSFSAMAAGASPPDFAPNPSVGWFSYAREFIPPASGAGPVGQDPAHPHVSNDEFRVTGRQATFPMGDPNSPILQPWAADRLRKRNERILSGTPDYPAEASCWPRGVLDFVLSPMTRPMYFVQGPREVVMILTSYSDVRRIYLADRHSEHVKPSWYGESIGHYEGDTLVVDTIGLNGKTLADEFGTPHTDRLHVIERYHLIDGGKTLELNIHVEDPGAFTMPWNAIQRYRQFEAAVAKIPVERLAVLATPEEGPLTEAICPENPNSFFPGMPTMPVPQAAVPDF